MGRYVLDYYPAYVAPRGGFGMPEDAKGMCDLYKPQLKIIADKIKSVHRGKLMRDGSSEQEYGFKNGSVLLSEENPLIRLESSTIEDLARLVLLDLHFRDLDFSLSINRSQIQGAD